MVKSRHWLIVLLVVTGLPSCFSENRSVEGSQTTAKLTLSKKQDAMDATAKDQWLQVTVIFNSFEGGFYGLETSSQEHLLPENLPEKFQIPGTQLKVKGERVEGVITTVQWGTVFKITELQLVLLGDDLSHKKAVK